MLIYESLSHVEDVLIIISSHELDIASPSGSNMSLDYSSHYYKLFEYSIRIQFYETFEIRRILVRGGSRGPLFLRVNILLYINFRPPKLPTVSLAVSFLEMSGSATASDRGRTLRKILEGELLFYKQNHYVAPQIPSLKCAHIYLLY